MRIFLDSADQVQIEKAVTSGLISGVTTNPSLLSQQGQEDPKSIMSAICALFPGPVSLQVLTTKTEDMIKQGRALASLASNAVIKLPLTPDGLAACVQLRGEGIAINITLCFSVTQAVLAARAGASYISPFLGRFEDVGGSPEWLLREIRTAYDAGEYPTQILAASIRNREHFEIAALCQANVATLPFAVFEDLYLHPLTMQGLQKFTQDAQKMEEFI